MKFKPTKCDLCEMNGESKDAIGRYYADDDCSYFICRKCAELVEKENFHITKLT